MNDETRELVEKLKRAARMWGGAPNLMNNASTVGAATEDALLELAGFVVDHFAGDERAYGQRAWACSKCGRRITRVEKAHECINCPHCHEQANAIPCAEKEQPIPAPAPEPARSVVMCSSCRYNEYPCSHPDKGDESDAGRLSPNCLGLKGYPFPYRLWEAKPDPALDDPCDDCGHGPEAKCEYKDQHLCGTAPFPSFERKPAPDAPPWERCGESVERSPTKYLKCRSLNDLSCKVEVTPAEASNRRTVTRLADALALCPKAGELGLVDEGDSCRGCECMRIESPNFYCTAGHRIVIARNERGAREPTKPDSCISRKPRPDPASAEDERRGKEGCALAEEMDRMGKFAQTNKGGRLWVTGGKLDRMASEVRDLAAQKAEAEKKADGCSAEYWRDRFRGKHDEAVCYARQAGQWQGRAANWATERNEWKQRAETAEATRDEALAKVAGLEAEVQRWADFDHRGEGIIAELRGLLEREKAKVAAWEEWAKPLDGHTRFRVAGAIRGIVHAYNQPVVRQLNAAADAIAAGPPDRPDAEEAPRE